MTWHNRRAWHVSLASECVTTMVTLPWQHCYYRWLVKSCTVGELLPTDAACLFTGSQDNGTSDKPDFDVQVL